MSESKPSTTTNGPVDISTRAAGTLVLARACRAALEAYREALVADVEHAISICDDVEYAAVGAPTPKTMERWNWVSSFALDIKEGTIYKGAEVGREAERRMAEQEFEEHYSCDLPLCMTMVRELLDFATGTRSATLFGHIRSINNAIAKLAKVDGVDRDTAMSHETSLAFEEGLGFNHADPADCCRPLPSAPNQVRS